MSSVKAFLRACATISFAVLIHEMGHAIAMLAFGIALKRVSIGIGPALVSGDVGGTTIVLALLPVGGFVEPRDATDLLNSPFMVQLIVSLSGIAVNTLCAFLCVIAIRNRLQLPNVWLELVPKRYLPKHPLARELTIILAVILWSPIIFFHTLLTGGPRAVLRDFVGPIGMIKELMQTPSLVRVRYVRQRTLRPADQAPGLEGSRVAQLLNGLLFLNVGLAGLNLLPLYPLDGSRFVRALFWIVNERAADTFMTMSVVCSVALVGILLVTWMFTPWLEQRERSAAAASSRERDL